jgi:hypothetical protein
MGGKNKNKKKGNNQEVDNGVNREKSQNETGTENIEKVESAQ